jgi:hypothetical protein
MAADRIRLTISVTPEVHEVFTRMSDAAGISLGKCMGDWLGDTIDGAQFVAQKMEEARKAPRVVMREMQAFAKGLSVEVDATVSAMRRRPGPASPDQAARPPSPPSSNTGGKVPRGNPAKGKGAKP